MSTISLCNRDLEGAVTGVTRQRDAKRNSSDGRSKGCGGSPHRHDWASGLRLCGKTPHRLAHGGDEIFNKLREVWRLAAMPSKTVGKGVKCGLLAAAPQSPLAVGDKAGARDAFRSLRAGWKKCSMPQMVQYPRAIPKTNAATIVNNSRNESMNAFISSSFSCEPAQGIPDTFYRQQPAAA